MRSHILLTAQMWKKCKSILLCAAFTVCRGTQPGRVIPLWNWARKAWVRRLLKTHSYLQSGCFMGQEGWVVWQTPGAIRAGQGLPLAGHTEHSPTANFAALREGVSQALHTWSTTAVPSSRTGMAASPAPSWHGLISHPFAWLLAPARGGCTGDGVLWPTKLCVCGVTLLLHPLCPRGACGDTFPLLQWQRRVERLWLKLRLYLCYPHCFLSLDYFLRNYFAGLNFCIWYIFK